MLIEPPRRIIAAKIAKRISSLIFFVYICAPLIGEDVYYTLIINYLNDYNYVLDT